MNETTQKYLNLTIHQTIVIAQTLNTYMAPKEELLTNKKKFTQFLPFQLLDSAIFANSESDSMLT